jgi:hypothetical protein
MVWFLVTLPYAGLTMTALEYRTALRFRTGHEVLSSTGRCRFCTTGHFDTFGFHELSCPGQGRLVSCHNALRDCLYSLGQQAGLSVQQEPQNLLQDGTGHKPADVLFGSFYHGRDLCVDVTIVNPFTDIHKKLRDPDSFLQSAVTHKRQHYAARCNTAGKLFAVCAFEVSGGINLSEMKSVLKRIHRVILKDRIFLTNQGLSAPFVHDPKVQCLFHDITPIDCCHSW